MGPAVGELLLLRAQLQRFLTVQGAVLGAGVLAAAALRNAVLAGDQGADFPNEPVLIQGAGFSVLIALVWAPVHAGLGAVADAVRDTVVGTRASDQSWVDWQARRRAFDDVVGPGDLVGSFRSGVAIFTPLAGALVGLLLGS